MSATAETPAEAPAPAAGTPRPHAGGPNPALVAAVAFALGVVLARVVDWMGHGYPKR